jgi:hypothetical protein
MKKYNKYLLILTFITLFYGNNLFSQVDLTAITGKRWKIEQFYGNKVRYDTPSLDSVSYEYRTDHTVRVYVIGMSGYNEMNYSFQGDSLIFSASGVTETYRYKLLYLDQHNLIYEGVCIDPETQEQIDVEYRFKPED